MKRIYCDYCNEEITEPERIREYRVIFSPDYYGDTINLCRKHYLQVAKLCGYEWKNLSDWAELTKEER